MKPKLKYQDALAWMEAFDRIKALPEGTQLGEYTLSHVLDAPHPPSVWLRSRKGNRAVRFGDAFIHELRTI